MASNNTINDDPVRNLIGDWYFNEFWHTTTRPSEAMHLEYTKALMNLAAADGVLAEEERQWILGNTAAKGATNKIIEYVKTYTPTKADLEALMKEKPTFSQFTARALIFEAFLAASADNELHQDERNAICQLGKVMGIDEAIMKQIEQAFVNEKKHRDQVVTLMFPQGLKKTIQIVEVDFKET
ncbi:unnamed protein product [Adineta steineri]|uniref:Co-chaperone DjlA N-terminal domain-containing protein n=1 Tax=Adineta steineri TaxID=433720 RepID=A0A819BYE8_9BILA|nr:unnamed protein product [Adineta steineri]CAF3802354.1 unnamed protein product [Adineta steineri]CAF3990912.1 unnamed protein product [Adineta steineri]